MREIQYVAFPDACQPVLLARVRWPDVFQAASLGEPDWRTDPGLCDLPYDPNAQIVTRDQAEAIAKEWGVTLPAFDEGAVPGPSLIRRMPADWSHLSPAVRRAWLLDLPRKRSVVAEPERRRGLLRRRRKAVDEAPVADEPAIVLRDVAPDDVVIDLTEAEESEAVASAEAT